MSRATREARQVLRDDPKQLEFESTYSVEYLASSPHTDEEVWLFAPGKTAYVDGAEALQAFENAKEVYRRVRLVRTDVIQTVVGEHVRD